MTSIAALNKLIDKTSDWDKDERYMATNDLCIALGKDIKIDENMEQRICAAVLKQLDDQSNDVQSVAVKCLAIITKKVQQAQIGEVCKKLCSLILDGKDALRDVYSIGLKTLIMDVPDTMGPLVSEKLTSKLLGGISRNGSETIQRECLDNMADLLRRFGHLNAASHHSIMTSVVQQLQNEKVVVRKRAANCLGSLVVVSSDTLLNSLMQILLERIEASESSSSIAASSGVYSVSTRTLIQTIGTISRTVGYRLGKHLDRIVPLFLRFCGDPLDESQQSEAANELRENCFPGLESFVLRCPREVAPFLKDILRVSIGFMKYDPNYAYDEEEDEDNDDAVKMSVEEEEEEGYEEEGDSGSQEDDDDDTSWKVRKAAVKVIAAIITQAQRFDNNSNNNSGKKKEEEVDTNLQTIYAACGDALVQRFKEREENVRLDIIACYTNLVHQAAASVGPINSLRITSAAATSNKVSEAGDKQQVLSLLQAKVPSVTKACSVQLQSTSAAVKSKSAVFVLLRTLINALHGGLDRQLPNLIQLAIKCLLEKGSQNQQILKLDTLIFIRVALELHAPSVVQPSVSSLLDAVVTVAGEEWYKLITESLRVLTAMIPVVRPRRGSYVSNSTNIEEAEVYFDNSFQFTPLVHKIYAAVYPRLVAADLDHEIKEHAILAVGTIFSYTGDKLSSQWVEQVQPVLRRRLENETLRAATLKTLMAISRSPIRLDVSDFLADSAQDLAMFLRQSSRTLRQLTLQALEAMLAAAVKTSTTNTPLSAPAVEIILKEAASLINDADLHLSHLSMQLAITILLNVPSTIIAGPVYLHTYPQMQTLARSSLIQGQAQQSLINLFQTLVNAHLPCLSYDEVVAELYNPAADLPKQGISNLSKCIAGVILAMRQQSDQQTDTVDAATSASLTRFASDVQHQPNVAKSFDSLQQLALLCLGEVGQQHDLSTALPQLQQLILSCFSSTSAAEETKLAAAYALGHIAVANMSLYLPLIVEQQQMQKSNDVSSNQHQYLLLVALKEIIVTFANLGMDFRPHLPLVLPVLLEHCRCSCSKNLDEDSVRSMVAECLGVLTTMSSEQLMPLLLQLLQKSSTGCKDAAADTDADKLSRRMIANALRVALSRSAFSSVDTATALLRIAENMTSFLPLLLHDSDLEVKRSALLMVNTAIHHNPSTVQSHLSDTILPALIETMKIKLERIVDLGPFKHKVDDNTPLRKISLTCLESILDISGSGDSNGKNSSSSMDTHHHEERQQQQQEFKKQQPVQRLDVMVTGMAIMQIMPLLLTDKDELKMQAHEILCKLCSLAPSVVLSSSNTIEQLIAPLSKTVGKRPSARDSADGSSSNVVGPEAERALDLVKSGLRAVLAVNKLEDVGVISRRWYDFVTKLSSTEEHTSELLKSLQAERNDLL